MQGIKDKVAIVTGGTRGIGFGIAQALIEGGAKVIATYQHNQKAAQKARIELDRVGSADQCMVMASDVSDRSECSSVVAAAVERWGQIDFLINNAGVFDFSYLDEMSEQFLDKMLDINLKGTINMMAAAIPSMKERGFGRIINASSISGHFADAGLVAYAASKAGVDITTRIAAAELGPFGITVNAFAPGIIDTDMTHGMIEERGELQVRQIPVGRFGATQDVSGLVVFLCSSDSHYITGEVIGVDGGMMKVQNPYRAIDRAHGENS